MNDPQRFAAWLKSGPRLGDGAMGTMLQRAGLPLNASPDAWNLERPEAVRAVHEAYRDAGSELLQTNSFGGNRVRLLLAGLGARVAAVNAAAVRLAREVAGPAGLLVAGTMGPTGERWTPGSRELAEAADVFAEQAAALASAGVDVLLVETMTDLREALTALEAARSVAALPVVTTLTFGTDARTLAGDDPVTAASQLADAGAAAVGANCGAGPAALVPVLRRMRAACRELPLVAQPSAGLPLLVGGRARYEIEPPAMASWARRLVEAGADLIGGCCGTTPEHIRAMGEALRGR